MDRQRWKTIDDVFERILEIGPRERANALARISAGDDDLRRSVEALLEFEARAEGFLQSSAIADLAAQVAGELVEVVELLYFADRTIDETADILGVSTATVKRRWKKAKIYLLKILTCGEVGGNGSATMENN